MAGHLYGGGPPLPQAPKNDKKTKKPQKFFACGAKKGQKKIDRKSDFLYTNFPKKNLIFSTSTYPTRDSPWKSKPQNKIKKYPPPQKKVAKDVQPSKNQGEVSASPGSFAVQGGSGPQTIILSIWNVLAHRCRTTRDTGKNLSEDDYRVLFPGRIKNSYLGAGVPPILNGCCKCQKR